MVESGVLAFAGLILTGVLTAFGVMLRTQANRITEVEDSLEQAKLQVKSTDEFSQRLWKYCRHILDMYYKHRKDGAPDPPELPQKDD
jgi:hypothetical protein